MPSKIVRETFVLESCKNQINLSQPYSYVKKLRISRLLYKTASVGNYILLIIVSGFHEQHKYNHNNRTTTYTKLMILPRVSAVEIDYECESDIWDCTKDRPTPINSFMCELVINNDYSITDISPSNPIYIEFEMELNDE